MNTIFLSLAKVGAQNYIYATYALQFCDIGWIEANFNTI